MAWRNGHLYVGWLEQQFLRKTVLIKIWCKGFKEGLQQVDNNSHIGTVRVFIEGDCHITLLALCSKLITLCKLNKCTIIYRSEGIGILINLSARCVARLLSEYMQPLRRRYL